MFDATLARLYHDLQTAQARQAGAAQQLKQAKENALSLENRQNGLVSCTDLKLEIAS